MASNQMLIQMKYLRERITLLQEGVVIQAEIAMKKQREECVAALYQAIIEYRVAVTPYEEQLKSLEYQSTMKCI